jgi:hypothetical protein
MKRNPIPPPQPRNRNASGRIALRPRIEAFCRSCIYDPQEPGHWKAQVGACTSTDCPLYDVRPRLKERKR